MNNEQLQKIADENYAVPAGKDPEAMIPGLVELLGSPDQIARERSMEILGNWGSVGHFRDETLRDLGDQMVEGLSYKLGEVDLDSVFRRSYSALVLCTPLGADQYFDVGLVEGRAGFLSSERVQQWCARAVEALRGEDPQNPMASGLGFGGNNR